MRRPAAVRMAAPGDAATKEAWSQQQAGGPPLPAWSDCLLSLLKPEITSLMARSGAGSMELIVWSDCGGMGMEMISMRDIQDNIQRMTGFNVTAKLYCFCDKAPACRTFAAANHAPLHITPDIQARDFTAGTYYCETHG